MDNLLYSLSDLKNIRDNFVEELSLATSGNKTSLGFIKTPVPDKPVISDDEVFQVMAIGGTNFETALMKKHGKRLKIILCHKGRVPLFKTREVLCAFFEKQLDNRVKTVGLNFAWDVTPVIRNGFPDGIRHGTSGKEHAFAGLFGKIVGREMENYLYYRKKRRINVACANDAICLLLAGLENNPRDKIVAGVVGSGMNFVILLDKNTAVNLESGNFNKFTQTPTGVQVSKNTIKKEYFLYEKELAGRYLYQHFNLLVKNGYSPAKSTKELSVIAREVSAAGKIAQALLERSASLIACQITGIYLFKKQSKLIFLMEGTLFWHGWQYQHFVKKYLGLLGVPEKGISFLYIKNSNLTGAARLVTGT